MSSKSGSSRRITRRTLWVACAPLLLLAVLACDRAEPRAGRVLLVGIDGASPRLVTPLLEKGRLPHLRTLASGGVYAPLRSHPPMSSPRIWTSIATGMLPERHGILGFGYDDEEGERHLFTSTQRTAPALWNIASAKGLRVGVVNWWNTYPVEKLDGVVVSDHLLPSDIRGRRKLTGSDDQTLGTIAWPEEWDARAKGHLDDDAPLTDVPDPFADRDALPGWSKPERLSRRYQNDADVLRIALDVEETIDPDVLMVFLPGIDRVSHVLWATLEPDSAYRSPMPFPPGTREAGAEAIRQYYVYTDALIGRLMERFDLDRDLVVVVSDHGFEPGQNLGFLTGVHETMESIDGVFFAHGPGVQRPGGPHRHFSVNDVTPTILAWQGLPPAQDMDGRPLPILDRPVPRFVASYRGLPIDRLSVMPSGAEKDILEQLGALGYLESDEDDPEE